MVLRDDLVDTINRLLAKHPMVLDSGTALQISRENVNHPGRSMQAFAAFGVIGACCSKQKALNLGDCLDAVYSEFFQHVQNAVAVEFFYWRGVCF